MMLCWKDNIDYIKSLLSTKTVTYKKQQYTDNIITFDIETTSYQKDAENYYSWCYIWQCCINGEVFFGRRIEEFTDLLSIISETLGDSKYIIFVHNLGFEQAFLTNVLNFDKMFARKSHKPIYCEDSRFNVEFRCTLMLYNKSLEKLAKETKYNKMVGDLDYKLIRTSDTELTEEELGYCENDVLIIYEKILQELKTYKHVCKIPLTQTGKVRRKVQKLYDHDIKYKKNIRKMQPKTIDMFAIYCKVFAGGYTHANASYTGIVVSEDNFGLPHSQDIASSYPREMLNKLPRGFYKYSIQSFDELNFEDLHFANYTYILYVTFYDIKCTFENTYISGYKCEELVEPIFDNGRIVKASKLSIWLTIYDLDIILQTYQFNDYNINASYCAKNAYLDIKYINFMLDLYQNKTSLKGIPEQYDVYVESKQYINSLYGNMCTNEIRDEAIFKDGEWSTHKLTNEEVQEKLDNKRISWSTVLCFQWGCFITAAARWKLWKYCIIPKDKECLYCDTDSIKFVGGDDFVEDFNKWNLMELERISKERHIPLERFMPSDIYGNKHVLGELTKEDDMNQFVTLGAKKYCYTIGDELHLTLSGVNKEKGAKALVTIDNFKDGFIFKPEVTGKLTLWYISDQPSLTVTDYQGHKTYIDYRYGIYMQPTTYALGISDNYEAYLDYIALKDTTQWSGQYDYIIGGE